MSSLRLVPVSGQLIEVVKEPSMVGRDPSCEIVVTDGSVSRRHALLERRGAAWWVVDQGSANGTYLNSQRVAEHALKSGQELRFGALAFRVDLVEDPEATVATPILDEAAAATLMTDGATDLPPLEPAVPPAPAPPPIPRPAAPARPPVPPIPPAAAAPPPVRSAAPGAVPPRPAPSAPVPQMPAGGPPPKKGRSPVFWVITGCCGCLLFGALLVAVIGGGAFMATRPAANAAQQWLAEVRENRVDDAAAGLSSEYRARLSAEDLQAITEAIRRSKDATFIQRSVDNDRAVLKGALTGSGGAPQPITIHLVKESGAWKVDEVRLGVE